MKHRNIHPLPTELLHDKALRRLDILQIDPAKRRLHRGDNINELFRIQLGKLDIENIDPGKFLEKHGFSFHHGLGSKWPDCAKAENCRSIGDHADKVPPRRQLRGLRRIFCDGKAWMGDAG